MIKVDPIFLDIVKDSRVVGAVVGVYRMNEDGNQELSQYLNVVDGSVEADRDSNTRRTLTCTVTTESWEDDDALLDIVGTRLQVWAGVDSGARQLLAPVGVFRLNTISRSGQQTLSISATSLESYLIDYTFYVTDGTYFSQTAPSPAPAFDPVIAPLSVRSSLAQTVAATAPSAPSSRIRSTATSRAASSGDVFRPPPNANRIWDFLILECQATKKGAAAVLGNLHQESGLRPEAVEGNGEGHGIVQWSFGRKTGLMNFARSQGKSWSNLEVQLQYMKKELNGSYKTSLDVIQSATLIADATYKFHRLYEGSNDTEAMIKANRIDVAFKYYRALKGRNVPGSSFTVGVSGRMNGMAKKPRKKNPNAGKSTQREAVTDDPSDISGEDSNLEIDTSSPDTPSTPRVHVYPPFTTYRIPIIDFIIREAVPGTVQIDVTEEAWNADAVIPKEFVIEHGANAWEVVQVLASSISCNVYVTPWGSFKIDTAKRLQGTSPVARITEGPDGVLVSMGVETTREESYNGVFVIGSSPEMESIGISGFTSYRVVTVPGHPMEWGGPFGKKMLITENNELLTTQELADNKAEILLQEVAALTRSLDFSAIPNPLLEPEDVVELQMLDGTIEHHLLTRMTIPLNHSGGWSANTLSTRVKPSGS